MGNRWHQFRCWWFRRFQFRQDRCYGNWAQTTETLDLASASVVMEREAKKYIPARYMGLVSYFSYSPIPGSCDPLHQFPCCGWKYVPEKKG